LRYGKDETPSIAESEAEYDKETGKYNYSIINGFQ
jgi:hypothetical protein